jgi:Uma2 family endonuclease
MSAAIDQKLSFDEFVHLPELASGHELIRGEVVPVTPSNLLHSWIAAVLSSRMTAFVIDQRLGGVFVNDPGFRLAPDTLRGPDVAFISAARLPARLEAEFAEFAPDLAVEVVSPGDTAFEVEDKVRTYFDAGVRMVWIVYPNRKTVHAFRKGDQACVYTSGSALDGEDVLPGFKFPLAELFSEPVSTNSNAE